MKRLLLLPSLLLVSSMSFSQVGIGTDAPSTSAILDIQSNNKGLLIPRVALTSSTDKASISGGQPATGLLVYNIGTFNSQGYYYWDGAEWKQLDESPSVNPSIDALQCANASLNPLTYTIGTEYDGYMTIPYTGGNGGKYAGGTDGGTAHGLTYSLQGDKLSNGSGNLVYTVKGYPTVSSPQETDFPINFLGKTCTATLGTGNIIDFIKYARRTVRPINADTPTLSETSIGSLIVRYNSTSATQLGYLEIKTTTPTHISWLYHKAGTAQAGIETYGQIASTAAAGEAGWFKLRAVSYQGGQIPLTAGEDLNSQNRDLGYIILTLHNTNEVYRVTVNTNGSIAAQGAAPETTSAITIFVEQLGEKDNA